MHFHSDYWYMLHVTLDRIFVIRWQKGQSCRKTETKDVHAPDMERLKRTSNEYIMNGFSSTSQMSPNEKQTTNEHVPDNPNAGCIKEKPNTERTSTGACRIQQGIAYLGMHFSSRPIFEKVALRNASPQCLVEESKKTSYIYYNQIFY
mgnify:CR=1 FL=1